MPPSTATSSVPLEELHIGFLGARGPGNADLINLLSEQCTYGFWQNAQLRQHIDSYRRRHPGGRVHLYGYSLGGWTAVRFCNAHAEELGGIHRLVIFDAYHWRACLRHGAGNLRITTKAVATTLNFYQREPITWRYGIPFGLNPFHGATIYSQRHEVSGHITQRRLVASSHVMIVRDAIRLITSQLQ